MSWPMVKLGELTDKVKSWNPLTSSEAEPFIYIDLSSVDKESKKIDGNLVAKVLPLEAPSRARQLVRENDIIVATVRPNLNGVALIESKYNGSTASTGYCVLRPKENKLYSKYLFYWVQTDLFIADMMSKATGANYPAVSDRIIKDSQIPLPPLEEQKRIAAILDKADGIRRKRQQAIQLADDFLRAVFLDMFGDPVTNPKGWEVARLGDVVESQLGKMLSKKAKVGNTPKKYLRNANVRWRKFDLNSLLEMDFDPKEKEKFELKNGDLLVCEGGEVGRCSIWRENVLDCYYQKALHRVRPKQGILIPEYVQEYFFWMSKRGGLLDSVSEVTFSHLTAEKLKELKIPLPPISLQNRFEVVYKSIEMLLHKNEYSIQMERDSVNSLSQKAFSGEL